MSKPIMNKYSSATIILKPTQSKGSLLLGDCNSALDKHYLKPHKVKTIITIGHDAVPEKKQSHINYIFYPIHDNKGQKIIDILDEISDSIEDGRSKGGVLIHCFTGTSRSPTFAIAYLMKKKLINYDVLLAYLKKQRSVINPSDHFKKQLKAYWKILMNRQEEKQKKEEEGKKNENLINSIDYKRKRGVRGAVKSASRSISPKKQNKKQKKKEKGKQKQFDFEQRLKTIFQAGSSKSKEKRAISHVKGIYSSKVRIK